ncbi:hypothetical protein EDC01DRAFT_669243 [Geopyxis carbonaria]|nr:hypothetical protein EDC01DRAFT_669243 [Geopyxis carbonaria]
MCGWLLCYSRCSQSGNDTDLCYGNLLLWLERYIILYALPPLLLFFSLNKHTFTQASFSSFLFFFLLLFFSSVFISFIALIGIFFNDRQEYL